MTGQVALLLFLAGFFLLPACRNKSKAEPDPVAAPVVVLPQAETPQAKIAVTADVPISRFFGFLEKLLRQNDTLGYCTLSENLLLRANPWILDSLVATDYYAQMSRGNFVYDQRKLIILHAGDTLLIPGPQTAAVLLDKMAKTWLDINIPAFDMRIMEGDSVLFHMPVRVGKDQAKYLELAGGRVDLRTRTGTGEIIRVNRNPLFLDPVTGKKFKFTKRDDHKTTWMPLIPWLEPSINGQRYGQMIHPTTNPRTLGKPASNGCIGVGEADGWRVYFFAPLGTKVVIRYDLMEITPAGDTLRYPDVYRLHRPESLAALAAGVGLLPVKTASICLCDSLF